jgi:hypothetical protein
LTNKTLWKKGGVDQNHHAKIRESAPFFSLTGAGIALGAGGNAESTGMLLAVLATLESVKTDLPRVLNPELGSGKGLDRAGIDADAAFPAGFIDRRPGLEGGIR